MTANPAAPQQSASPESSASGMLWGEGSRWHDDALWLRTPKGQSSWTDAFGTWIPSSSRHPTGSGFFPTRLVPAMIREKRIGVWNGPSFDTYADLADADGPLGDMIGDEAGNL